MTRSDPSIYLINVPLFIKLWLLPLSCFAVDIIAVVMMKISLSRCLMCSFASFYICCFHHYQSTRMFVTHSQIFLVYGTYLNNILINIELVFDQVMFVND